MNWSYDGNKKITIYAACACTNKTGIWIVNGMLPLILFYSYKEKRITFTKVIPGCKNQLIAMFGAMYETENELYLIPNNEKRIVVYDKRNEEFKEIKLENVCANMFRGCVFVKGILYCVPYRYDFVIGIDVETHEIKYESRWKEANGLPDDYYTNDFAINDNHMYMVVPDTDCIWDYDLKEHKWCSHIIGNEKTSFSSICSFKKNVCVFEYKNSDIYEVNLKENIIEQKQHVDFKSVLLISAYDEKIIIDNVEDDEWILDDLSSGMMKRYFFKKSDQINAFASPYHYGCWFKNEYNELCCIDNANHLIKLKETMEKIEEKLDYSVASWNDILNKNSETNPYDMISENEIYTLKSYISMLKENNKMMQ